MRRVRLALAIATLAGLAAAGCVLISAQVLVTYDFAAHGFDPLIVTSPAALAGVPVDLNTVKAYNDHKSDLQQVSDLALVGKITNLTANATDAEVWMVANPGTMLTTDAAVRNAGVEIWGPLHLGPNGVVQVGWDASSKLFVGRQALIDEIKGDGRFDLYVIGSGSYSYRVDKGALIAVLAAGR